MGACIVECGEEAGFDDGKLEGAELSWKCRKDVDNLWWGKED